MGAAQIILVVYLTALVAFNLSLHDTPIKDGRHSAWGAIVRCAIILTLTIWGGFFSEPAQAQIPSVANTHKRTLLRAAQTHWGLDAPVAVFAAQVHQESAWRPDAVSHAGARGLAQFMPGTATWWCEMRGIAKLACQPHNPTWALRALVGYDRFLYDRAPAHYDLFDRWWVTLRAYNGGLDHWQNEARATGLTQPTRAQVDAACGKARRHALHCRENLGYPQRILIVLQPRYLTWGPGL